MKGTFNGYILREELVALKDRLNTYSGLTALLGVSYDTRKEAEEDLSTQVEHDPRVLEVTITAEIGDGDGDESAA